MHRADKWACLIIFSGRRLLRSTCTRAASAPRAFCTEPRLLRVTGRRPATPAPVPPAVARVRRTTVPPRMVLVLVMVRRRCIHTAFKPSRRAAHTMEKKKIRSIRNGRRAGRCERNIINAS